MQGEVVTSLTDGVAAVDVMNAAGYDYAVPGNHEFDYGMDVFKELSGQVADVDIMPAYQFLSANFVDLTTNAPVFKAYDIQDIGGGRKVAFVGISTPETYTKSTPEYFQDENGNYIYSFCEGSQTDPSPFYAKIQEAVDSARAEGATTVIAVGHLGTDAGSAPYRSYDAIANTSGIDAFIDGHSHSTIPSETVNNKDGQPVLLTSTGTKVQNIGKMTIVAGQGRIRNIPADSEEAHRYVETGRVEPTTKEGSVTYTCSLCGATKIQVLAKLPAQPETPPAKPSTTPPKTSPKTSDTEGVEIYFILAAVAGLAGMEVWRRRERKHSA